MIDSTTCKGCGKPIVFVTTDEGKTVPLDLRPPVYRPLTNDVSGIWVRDRTAAVSHFATCARANDFSDGGKRRPGGAGT